MKIWLTKNSEVTVHQQLIAQISIGVAAQDLKIGEKLPSTRELARRFKIHQNTVSNAYHELAEQGWLEFRPGSGFYVPEKKLENFPDELDQIIAKFFQTAQSQGFTLSEIQARLPRFFEIQPPHHFLVVESDEGLREILRAEISQATNYQVRGVNFDEFKKNPNKTGAILVAMDDETIKINSILPAHKTCIFLKMRSVAESLQEQNRPSVDALIAIVSGWEKFLWLAKTMLLAARIEPDCLMVRSTQEPNWSQGLNEASLLICDSLTAGKLQPDQRFRVFNLISETSLEELNHAIN